MSNPTLPPPTEPRGLAAAVGLWLCGLLPAVADGPWRDAPNPAAVPFNQLAVAGNACGPAALLNAFRFGDADWQRAAAAVAGETDKGRLLTVIRTWGLRPSQSLAGQKRWGRHGVNADDLRDMANEMTRPQLLPLVRCEALMIEPGESPAKLLARVHARLERSLARGLPPIVSIRRLALRKETGKAPEWIVLQGHYVTITGVPRKLEKNAGSFPVRYLDPWGGRPGAGQLAVSERAFVTGPGVVSPCIDARLPQADVGKKLVRQGEPTLLTVAAGIGKW